ncbi:SDR family NAD(P)-dependent oxidoreductase [Pseudalkalibacillus berkeleyi]|uniref:SDR family NAD(P)-dependent oxidoreductase n=1 Tax=Pseudalkalibacillus berkeleyi TaxID=1069813 RepID=A0ABS9H3M3_9BACL|nr:SDR family NAD(P)-dependent oxidoreductase [Pseudalkalibacillus berkeleyi]MCF6138250.1 SDR family NAD(P)-dependent oxidoreductase [Pseudalkalibacillus berkeleyi]
MKSLHGKIAVVTGASRGAGRGIAFELGSAGATVYVTGRSVKGATTDNRTETIEETADGVTSRGGKGIAIRCDHTNIKDVRNLFEQIEREHSRIDILVNSVFGGSESSLPSGDGRRFWERPLEHWDAMMVAGPQAYLLTTRYAVPLMKQHHNGLIVNITFFIKDEISGNLYYDLAMNAINRMTVGMAKELKDFNVSAVAVCPGWMRTERVVDAGFGPEDGTTETTAYVGRAVVALASDTSVSKISSNAITVSELARKYGFTDVDGTQPLQF